MRNLYPNSYPSSSAGEAHWVNPKAVTPIDGSNPDPLVTNENGEVLDLFDSDLKDMDPFYHVYLVSKILGEAISIEFIMAKCTLERKCLWHGKLCRHGDGFSYLNSLMKLIATEYLMVSHGLWVDNFFVFRGGRKTLTLSKNNFFRPSFGFGFSAFLWKFRLNLFCKKFSNQLVKSIKLLHIQKPFLKVCLPRFV